MEFCFTDLKVQLEDIRPEISNDQERVSAEPSSEMFPSDATQTEPTAEMPPTASKKRPTTEMPPSASQVKRVKVTLTTSSPAKRMSPTKLSPTPKTVTFQALPSVTSTTVPAKRMSPTKPSPSATSNTVTFPALPSVTSTTVPAKRTTTVSNTEPRKRVKISLPREDLKITNFNSLEKKTVSTLPKIMKHQDRRVVLAMRKDGYTITDGHQSISNVCLKDVSSDLTFLNPQRLHIVDSTSFSLWWQHAELYIKHIIMPPRKDLTTRCEICLLKDCHRWLATVEGYSRLSPISIRPGPHPNKLDKSTTRHSSPAAICIAPLGYSITNGKFHVSSDGHPSLYEITKVLKKMNVSDLYAVNGYTAIKMNRFNTIPVKKLNLGESPLVCLYCKSAECHRFKAVVDGIRLILNYTVDPIRH